MTMQLKLSNRLEIIAGNIGAQTRFVDVGSDHAYLPCRVCMKDDSVFAIAGEVQKGPFENAVRTVEKYELTDKIHVRFGDGLEVISAKDKIDTVVIAGMGGQLITDILNNGRDVLDTINTIIVQPNTNTEIVRQYLHEKNFHLYQEFILEENNIIYEVLLAKKDSTSPYADDFHLMKKQFFYGPFLLKEKSPVFVKKWHQEYKHLENILTQMERAKQKDMHKRAILKTQKTMIKEDIL